jgi:choline-sulfatase
MDRIVEGGTWFRQSCIANPVCCPSRTSWYTGLMSEEHGQLTNNAEFNIDPATEDIGPQVKSGGYDSIYMGKWHVAKPVGKSFDLEFNGHGHGELGDAWTARAAEAFLANREGDKPFFLNIGLLNPHDCCMWTDTFTPCGPGKFSLAEKMRDELPELPPNHYLSAHPTVLTGAAADRSEGRWKDLDWRYYMYCYYRNVEMVDAEVGRVYDALINSRFRDNTVLIFASDHGDGLAEHYHYGKDCILEHSVMAPLVVVDPTARAHRDMEHMVSNIDVTATICDYAGVDPLPGRKGLSLRPLVQGKSPPWRAYAASTTSESRERIVRTTELKLLNDRLTQAYMLYDLVMDPWEMRDVAGDPAYAERLRQMKAHMDEYEASCHLAPQVVRMLEHWEQMRKEGRTVSTEGVFY